MVVEHSPSTQVPYGLRNTIGCFAADYPIFLFSNLHNLIFSIIVVESSKDFPAIKCILIIYFYMNSQFYIAAVINAILSSIVLFAAIREEADLSNASPIPPDEIAKLFNLLLSVCQTY